MTTPADGSTSTGNHTSTDDSPGLDPGTGTGLDPSTAAGPADAAAAATSAAAAAASAAAAERGRAWRIEQVRRELAETLARRDDTERDLARRGLAERGPTSVVSIRLDRGERAALERRAAAAGLRPAQLARNLIRIGLSTRGTGELSRAITRVEAAVAELRATIP